MPQPDNEDLFAIARAWCARYYPGRRVRKVALTLDDEEKVALPVPPAGTAAANVAPEPFIPTPFQTGILDALDGKAMRTDALGAAVGDRARLFRHPGGLRELREQGLVDHHKRLGYYRPDTPPEQMTDQV